MENLCGLGHNSGEGADDSKIHVLVECCRNAANGHAGVLSKLADHGS